MIKTDLFIPKPYYENTPKELFYKCNYKNYKNIKDSYVTKQFETEFIAIEKKERNLLISLLNQLYNHNKFIEIIRDKESYKVYFITFNYPPKSKVSENIQKTQKFLNLGFVDFAIYNNELYGNEGKRHHNHIVLFTKKTWMCMSKVIQRGMDITGLSRNYVDVKPIYRYKKDSKKIPKNYNKDFLINVKNKIQYVLGFKQPKDKVQKSVKDILFTMSYRINYFNSHFHDSNLNNYFLEYKKAIISQYRKSKKYEFIYKFHTGGLFSYENQFKAFIKAVT